MFSVNTTQTSKLSSLDEFLCWEVNTANLKKNENQDLKTNSQNRNCISCINTPVKYYIHTTTRIHVSVYRVYDQTTRYSTRDLTDVQYPSITCNTFYSPLGTRPIFLLQKKVGPFFICFCGAPTDLVGESGN